MTTESKDGSIETAAVDSAGVALNTGALKQPAIIASSSSLPISIKSISRSNGGPLGPQWQPYYNAAYSLVQFTFAPHVSLCTFPYIAWAWYRGDLQLHLFHWLVAFFVMTRVYIGIGMSLCYHRYFSHGAFKTSRIFQFVLAIVGAMTMQGGPLWWASKHIRHHKHCDQALDPHSPTQTSTVYAWLGWVYYETHIDWAYLPQRLLTPELLFVNLFFMIPNVVATFSLVPIVGLEWALFVCWVPACIAALGTTYFNVEFHPAAAVTVAVHDQDSNMSQQRQQSCRAINKEQGDAGFGPIRLDWLGRQYKYTARILFAPLLGEAYHEDHHDYPRRAHRPGIDLPYQLVLRPLEQLGVIWDLQQPLSPSNSKRAD